jgi:uncharacterized protein (AIM24 family)
MQAEIKGTTMPVLEVTLEPGEQVISTHGELSWMTPSIQMSQHMTGSGAPGSHGHLMQGLKRIMGGGGLFLTHYAAVDRAGMVTFAAKLPGHILPTDIAPGQAYFVHRHGWLCGTPGITPSIGLQQTFSGGLFVTRYEAMAGTGMVTFAAKLPGHIMPTDIGPGQAFFVHRHGWLCGTPGITPSIGLQQTFRGGLWGGDGFILQKLEGQGRAWIELSGELVHYTLAPGQTLMVHPGHVGMFEGSVQFSMTRVPLVPAALRGPEVSH